MYNERLAINQEQTVRYLGCGIRFFMAAALTASRLPDGCAPFALGCVAAAGSGLDGFFALLGTGLGCLLFLNFSAGLAHLAAAILIFTAANAFRDLKLMQKPLFFPAVAALVFFSVRIIYLLESPAPLNGALRCAAAALAVGLGTYCYRPLLRLESETMDPNALAFLGVTLLLALEEVKLGGLSVGRILAGCLVLCFAYQRGITAGAAAGICTGLAMDLCAGQGTLFFAAAYGFAGLAAGVRVRQNRLSAAACFEGAILLLLLPMTDALGGPLLGETLAALPLFLLLPARLFGGKRVQKTQTGADAGAAGGLRERLTRCAGAFRDLYDSMGRGAPSSVEENPAAIFDRAAERICRDCALCSLCWRKEYTSTFNALNDATPFLLERGRALPKDFPNHFTGRCIHLPDFLNAVNMELSAFLLRRQYRRQLEETRRSARGQYAQLSDLLSATAAGMEEAAPAFSETAPECRIGAALRPKKGESVCGDSVCSFRTENGTWCLLLSDGMGSGEEARRESALTLRLMRQFLEAGIGAEAALKTLNAALALRSTESQSFSTIDLLTIRPESGEAVLYKYGAAPTYVKRGGSVRRITGGTLPAGLRGAPAAPDITRFQLEPGSFAVMISDGVADAAEDDWLMDLLAGWDGSDPQVLAGLILTESIRRLQLADDCGIQALYLEASEENQRKRA